MTKRIEVLDHGYVELIEHWGSDELIIEAARMSTQKGFLGWGPKGLMCPHTGCDWTGDASERVPSEYGTKCPKCGETDARTVPGDEKLLRYLWTNNHATPFEMAGLIVEVQAPIFVFREWHRHRTQSYNEMSARYAPLPDVNYLPTIERCMLGGGQVTKQAGAVAGADALTAETAHEWRSEVAGFYAAAEALYQRGLRTGLPKELARVVLPVGRYSRMRASANLRNWLGFLTLRQPATAQWEIRCYASAVGALVERLFPRTHRLFAETAR